MTRTKRFLAGGFIAAALAAGTATPALADSHATIVTPQDSHATVISPQDSHATSFGTDDSHAT
ncbi:hypothetical protein [Streptomyces sp. NPDC046712]|uniref:hypothetical protein n=1 Tax=Streptomyces sp. NPDC046712 TaxID=3154802 RepID=UPI00340B4D0A